MRQYKRGLHELPYKRGLHELPYKRGLHELPYKRGLHELPYTAVTIKLTSGHAHQHHHGGDDVLHCE